MYLHTHAPTTARFRERLTLGSRRPLILVGPSGTGKSTAVRSFIAESGCSDGYRPFASGSDAEACGCEACAKIARGLSPDVLTVGGKAHVDVLRSGFRDFTHSQPVELEHRYLILEDVHLQPKAALDSTLKTLESPPPGLQIFLTASTLSTLPPAVPSRCFVAKHDWIASDRLAELVRKVPALSAHTKSLGNGMRAPGEFCFRSTKQVVAHSRVGLDARFTALFMDHTSYGTVEANAKALYDALASDPDYPVEESLPFAAHYLTHRYFNFLGTVRDKANGDGLYRKVHYLSLHARGSLFDRMGDPRAARAVNVEGQFVSYFLSIFCARKAEGF